MSEYIVRTKTFDKSIVQESGYADERGELARGFSRRVVSLEDEGIKQSLMKLGWTPPGSVASDELADAADDMWRTFLHTGARYCLTPDTPLQRIQRVTDFLRGRNLKGI